jgi:hypothetical protein
MLHDLNIRFLQSMVTLTQYKKILLQKIKVTETDIKTALPPINTFRLHNEAVKSKKMNMICFKLKCITLQCLYYTLIIVWREMALYWQQKLGTAWTNTAQLQIPYIMTDNYFCHNFPSTLNPHVGKWFSYKKAFQISFSTSTHTLAASYVILINSSLHFINTTVLHGLSQPHINFMTNVQ